MRCVIIVPAVELQTIEENHLRETLKNAFDMMLTLDKVFSILLTD